MQEQEQEQVFPEQNPQDISRFKPYAWTVSGIKKHTNSDEIRKELTKILGENTYAIYRRPNYPTASLFTISSTAPKLVVNSKELQVKKRKEKEAEDIAKRITPLCSMEYSEQLETKAARVKKVARDLGCDNFHIYSSPVEQGYRNRCEFTFGYSQDGVQTLGFRPGKFPDGPVLVVEPSSCKYNISQEILGIIAEINGILAATKEIVYNRITQKGYLKIFMIRRIGDQMIGAVLISAPDEGVFSECPQLRDLILSFPVDRLFAAFCESKAFEGFKDPCKLQQLKGEEGVLTQSLNGCTFRVPPLGFFQINLAVTEILCKLISEKLRTNKVVDVCCGSGVLGIAAGNPREILGVEIHPESVKEAEINGRENGVAAKYYCGCVKTLLPRVLSENNGGKEKEPVSLLLDPPRAGVPPKVIKTICSTPGISEVFYISCSYKHVLGNLQDLQKGFELEEVHALDMFPYTNELECLFIYRKNPVKPEPDLESADQNLISA